MNLSFSRKKYGGSKQFPFNAATTMIGGQLIDISKIEVSEAVSVQRLVFCLLSVPIEENFVLSDQRMFNDPFPI